MKKHKNCQSCGMPFSKDEKGGGTEKNGDKSTTYCSHCYENGEFTHPHITVDEMKQLVENKMVSFGFPRFLSKFFTRNIHKLDRWKNS
ncbi:zinc ribbon domain-containing protein [Bacillus sp. C1]